jgi:hypothetical protein
MPNKPTVEEVKFDPEVHDSLFKNYVTVEDELASKMLSRESAVNKLKTLGLTDDEVKALLG